MFFVEPRASLPPVCKIAKALDGGGPVRDGLDSLLENSQIAKNQDDPPVPQGRLKTTRDASPEYRPSPAHPRTTSQKR
jgi:hypothetical protein